MIQNLSRYCGSWKGLRDYVIRKPYIYIFFSVFEFFNNNQKKKKKRLLAEKRIVCLLNTKKFSQRPFQDVLDGSLPLTLWQPAPPSVFAEGQ